MKGGYMPTISVFYGITIIMYPQGKEHSPPHIHAFYGEHAASFKIKDKELYEGEFPIRATRLVKEFLEQYEKELLEMWETGNYQQLKGLD